MSALDSGVEGIVVMSDRQIDPVLSTRLRACVGLMEDEQRPKLIGIIDDAIYFALTSSFVLTWMQVVYETMEGDPDLDRQSRHYTSQASDIEKGDDA